MNGHTKKQETAIARVRCEVGSNWLTIYERHLIADFVISDQTQREACLADLEKRPLQQPGARLLPNLQRLHVDL